MITLAAALLLSSPSVPTHVVTDFGPSAGMRGQMFETTNSAFFYTRTSIDQRETERVRAARQERHARWWAERGYKAR